MKKFICLLLSGLILLGTMTACASDAGETTEATKVANTYQKPDPAADDTLNILMIGSSFCFYYVEELYGMLDAAGIKANVCNVYYSGCTLDMHWKWWKNGESNYDYYITNADGRHQTAGVNLEWCLRQQNWDVVSLQEGTTKTYTTGAQPHMDATKSLLADLWGYIKEQCPMARHMWHQPWIRPVGVAFNGTVTPSVEAQSQYAVEVQEYAKLVCKEFELERVPSGAAWQNVRNDYGYDNLCARIGKADDKGNPHGGDGSHDGDWGGGQYLNACVWFEVITGQSCIGNTFRPLYMAGAEDLSLSEDMIEILQASAHKAIEQKNAES